MKYLMILILLSSCGKHSMPDTQDFGDSDGDQVINEIDQDKFFAGVMPLEEITASMEFDHGISVIKKYTFVLSNKVNLNEYSKDLLVKNIQSIKLNDYFSEFSTLIVRGTDKAVFADAGLVPITLKFSNKRSQPKNLYLVLNGEKIFLGDWKQKMEIQLSNIQLNSVLAGEGFLSFLHQDAIEESIKQKTFRVFFNDGTKTTTYYISKELVLEQVLEKLQVTNFKFIDEENLLTTTMALDAREWWVRKINEHDIIVVFENLRNLSDHYLKGFQHNSISLKRENGVPGSPILFSKQKQSKALIKIHATKTNINFEEKVKKTTIGSGGGKESDKTECYDYYRLPVSKVNVPVASDFILENLVNEFKISNAIDQIELRELKDEAGTFWEIEVPAGIDEFTMKLNIIAAKEYIQTGRYKSTCEHAKPILRTIEGHLELKIETYIEKI